MKFTGERFIPEIDGEIYLEHYHRYYAILPFVRDKKVLDIACGEGYGTQLISKQASSVSGVDISAETVKHAKEKYFAENIEFKVGSTSNIPYPDATFDVLISFETIEHHDEHEQMMLEIKRVLKPEGILIISSPEKTNYNASLAAPNKFHVKELEFDDFKNLIAKNFNFSEFYFQNNVYGSILVSDHSNGFKLIDDKKIAVREILKPKYDICVASQSKLDVDLTSFFIGNEILNNRIKNLENQISNMEKSLTWKIGRFFLTPFSIFKR